MRADIKYIKFWTNLLVGMITIVAMGIIWPGGRVTKESESISKAAVYLDSGPISDVLLYRQNFQPEESYLSGISLQMNRDNTFQNGKEGSTIVSLYDSKDELLAKTTVLTKDITNKNYYKFALNAPLNKKQEYYYTVQVVGCESAGPSLRFGEKVDIGIVENNSIQYGGERLTEASTVCIYHYKKPLNFLDIATYYAFILFISSLIHLWVGKRYDILK